MKKPSKAASTRVLLSALGCFLVMTQANIACSVVRVADTRPSSPNVRLTVFKDSTPQANATLVVTLQTTGEQIGPALRTNSRGTAELRNLAPGTYCIIATAEPGLGADLCLEVSKSHDHSHSEFSLTLVPAPPPAPSFAELLERTAKTPPEVHAREFRGIVTDVVGAAIRGAAVVVYVSRSGEKPTLIELTADAEGRFFAPLNPGKYVAAFQSPGFKSRLVSFEIDSDEPQAFEPIVLQIGVCA